MKNKKNLLADFSAATRSGDKLAVAAAAKALVEAKAPIGRNWAPIVQAMLHDGETRLSRAAAACLVAEVGSDPSKFLQATALARTGALDEAQQVLEGLPSSTPDPYSNAYLRGTLATNIGNMAAAEAYLRQALSARPEGPEAWLALAMTGRLDESDHDALARHATAAGDSPDMAALLVAYGRSLEEQGRHEEAFEAYASAGRTALQGRAFDGVGDLADARGLLQQPVDIAGSAAPPSDAAPIFVSGLPRSGTTLVEQILASHSRVPGGGEVELLRQVARLIGGRDPANLTRYSARADATESPAAHYLRLAAERFGEGRIVDKSLSTSRLVPLAASLFPHSPFVWIRRDLQDCAWSIFRSHFVSGVEWGNRLEDIGSRFAVEEALLRHWTEQLGDRMLTVEFGDLVENSEEVISRIAEHCGLEPEPAMFTPHETARVVITNSAAQVREPINRKGIGSSAPYAEKLAPFREAYDATAARLT